MVDRRSLRLAAALLFVGLLFTIIVGQFHPDKKPANDHPAAFTEYADSDTWTAVHLGQFVGMGVIVAGLLVFFLGSASPGVASRLGAIAATLTLGVYAVLQAVDGVALKQVTVAWVRAPEAEKAARFAAAEAVRWTEWGVRSYHTYLLGISLILFAFALASAARIPRLVSILIGLCGLAYLAQGWIVGVEGFSTNTGIPTLSGYILWIVWSIWLLIVAWRTKETTRPAGEWSAERQVSD